MENKCYECADKRDAAVRLIGMVEKLVSNLPERGEFQQISNEEDILYENVPGVKYRLWLKADCFRNEVRNDVGKDSRFVEVNMVSEDSPYMVSKAVLVGHKDNMIQELQVDTFPDEYEKLIDDLIHDLRDA